MYHDTIVFAEIEVQLIEFLKKLNQNGRKDGMVINKKPPRLCAIKQEDESNSTIFD